MIWLIGKMFVFLQFHDIVGRGRMVKLSQHISAKAAGYFLLAVSGYSLFFQALYNMLRCETLLPYIDVADFAVSFVKNFVPILLLGIMNVAIVFRIPLPAWMEKRIIPKTFFDLAVSLCGLALVNFIYLAIGGMFSFSLSVHFAGTVLSDILILLFAEIAYYVCLSKELARRASELRSQAAEYRYDALKSQISPHFLFNSLNILYSLIDLDKEKSKEFTLSLTSVYRHVLSFRNRNIVQVSEELDLLQSYVDVLIIRYHNQFEVITQIDYPEGMRRHLIPFSVQLLLENVIKHNEVSSARPMRVEVEVGINGVRVSNVINPKKSVTTSGLGLKYIEQQYMRFGKSLSVAQKNGLFSATIPYL